MKCSRIENSSRPFRNSCGGHSRRPQAADRNGASSHAPASPPGRTASGATPARHRSVARRSSAGPNRPCTRPGWQSQRRIARTYVAASSPSVRESLRATRRRYHTGSSSRSSYGHPPVPTGARRGAGWDPPPARTPLHPPVDAGCGPRSTGSCPTPVPAPLSHSRQPLSRSARRHTYANTLNAPLEFGPGCEPAPLARLHPNAPRHRPHRTSCSASQGVRPPAPSAAAAGCRRPSPDHLPRRERLLKLLEIHRFALQRAPQSLDEQVVRAPPLPAIEIRIPAPARYSAAPAVAFLHRPRPSGWGPHRGARDSSTSSQGSHRSDSM